LISVSKLCFILGFSFVRCLSVDMFVASVNKSGFCCTDWWLVGYSVAECHGNRRSSQAVDCSILASQVNVSLFCCFCLMLLCFHSLKKAESIAVNLQAWFTIASGSYKTLQVPEKQQGHRNY